MGNSIAGIVGGGLGGTILQMVMGTAAGGGGGSLDLTTIMSNVADGGVGGAILMAIAGIIKNKTAAKQPRLQVRHRFRIKAFALPVLRRANATERRQSPKLQLLSKPRRLICLPIMKDWNDTVRFYRPRKEILDGTSKFPEAQAQ
jgi:hypothetical protein